jgi:phage tail sheath gpL-like
MSRGSQLHKLNTRGFNSQFERKALSQIQNSTGTDTAPAKLNISGLWSSTDTITVTLEIGAGDLTPVYSPGGNVDAEAAAVALAVQVALEADVSAYASGATVFITKTTAGTVNIVSSVIT